MVRKVVDSRVATLIKNCVQTKHRSFFVVVGDKGKEQVVNLHYLLAQAQVTSRPSVLWCYKKDLGFTSHRKKREAKIKREIKRGTREANTEDPFELFVTVTNIRYAYYKETQKILGNTYGMCILQDFEAITPNTLARTIETVEGGGMVVLLLKNMSSLKQLYTMAMDVHYRYRTEAHNDIVARFNERFILSLGSSENCLVVDDELNVLPISMGKHVKPLPVKSAEEQKTEEEMELDELKESLADTEPVGSLVKCARTVDQAKAVLTFIEAISEKSLRSTVALTAARGRGKSAALGIAMASAVAYGYSNIFVTSPSPENLKTLFEFVFKTFDALGYEEHLDYDIVQSTNPEFNKAIVRVNIFRQHRQTIQYIQPQDAHVLGQAELLVIDEAAAIPLPIVRKLLGPYLVFMASTINGYEGTGRSLSLKLIQQLREQSRGFVGKTGGVAKDASGENVMVGRDMVAKKQIDDTEGLGGRTLKEIKLEEPIRYGPNDPVEKWLNELLCLDASIISKNIQGCPHPSECELYYVNRDTLFSYHPVSETFLQRMMALYVASHYKNSPNDLQLMSDAPAHHLFVLLPPMAHASTSLPDPLVVVQVCLEGEISRQTVINSLSRGQRPAGDMIPWLVSQQFQDDDFASLSGARVVRIATHPDYANMGYGSRALELLKSYYQGDMSSLSESTGDDEEETITRVEDDELENADLKTDQIKVRDPLKMPPLLTNLSERRPPRLDYLGVSYGMTPALHKFWKRSGFVPLYVRQTANDLTGEHTCVMVNTLEGGLSSAAWLDAFAGDFSRRFLSLLSYQFREFPVINALSVLEAAHHGRQESNSITKTRLDMHFSPYDLKRLDSYSNNMLDYHVILDLIPTVAFLYFRGELSPGVKLSGVQSSILMGIGLQRKSVEDLEKELSLASNQVLAMFVKIVRKVSQHFTQVQSDAIEEESPELKKKKKEIEAAAAAEEDEEMMGTKDKRDIEDDEAWRPLKQSMDDELKEAGDEVVDGLKAKQREMIDKLDLSQYAIGGEDKDWSAAQAQVEALNKGKSKSPVVSIKNANSSKKRKNVSANEIIAKENKQFQPKKIKMSKKTRRS
ncbi:GNAT acetyltransferase 2-domain-containing protein [Zychaea mexicana]|uniref:GNAT acetyltransferase 2-domain-containing protein n=1 Tax=Zychaea mexicana TaxID=64656 RepID=UPI0022FDC8EB|nr:GNAT acetyltransferase 2-domain-containing protein [Zychaea mexicana]KAI9495055.1 GNAT acetyltransferase 2-domain-containing protein [Zychaea mexicana]